MTNKNKLPDKIWATYNSNFDYPKSAIDPWIVDKDKWIDEATQYIRADLIREILNPKNKREVKVYNIDDAIGDCARIAVDLQNLLDGEGE